MTNFAFAASVAAVRPAGAYLDEMMARVGVDGLTAAFAEPGLLALIDQHAAAVREALRTAGRRPDAAGLAAYARSLAAAAVRSGRPLPEPGAAPASVAGWASAGFPLLRVVAVCLIAVSSNELN
ncbi:DUF6401 family natural product biosynthesis protein [Actinoplanes derwentensis]|uniref:Uncharacterized protein n=1 Tax=Actinoplanes derwentensis TaxID=113562 RepID=A0A1H1PYL9_9ACTN|nr:DUF6401 family natural product biosynthesis protein [Actinoplanes derwentensis]GID82304.1 hypothetical protein Ade03nite_12280 [Actinoplanes derwentensis]SDS15799.1 hypothetical protein SAMN04489716_0142 [Actinoplanes derwentensis]